VMGAFGVNRPPIHSTLTQPMLDAAFAVCSERYPELLEPQVNPFAFYWSFFQLSRLDPKRMQLSSVMAELYKLPITTHVAMVLEPTEMAKHLQRFLCEAGMPWMNPILTQGDLSSIDSTSRVNRLTQALTLAISNAKDNEVFVLFVDLLSETMPVDQLLTTIKLARSKHHRVAIVCPSPTFLRPPNSGEIHHSQTAFELRMAAQHIRLKELALPYKRMVAKFGVPLAISGEPKAIPVVLSEIAIARTGRTISRGALQ